MYRCQRTQNYCHHMQLGFLNPHSQRDWILPRAHNLHNPQCRQHFLWHLASSCMAKLVQLQKWPSIGQGHRTVDYSTETETIKVLGCDDRQLKKKKYSTTLWMVLAEKVTTKFCLDYLKDREYLKMELHY